MRILAAALTSVLLATGAAHAETVETDIIDGTGEIIGTATLTESPHGVLIRIEIGPGGIEPGWHGIHLHQVGDCSDVGEFQLSGGHINPEGREHGLLNPEGPDAGDLPNIYAGEDGAVNAEMFTWLITLDELRDEDGSAIVIHENPDDHITQPIGGAGARIACAEVR
jgi:superoxide dismutase, Cu-Zn family